MNNANVKLLNEREVHYGLVKEFNLLDTILDD